MKKTFILPLALIGFGLVSCEGDEFSVDNLPDEKPNEKLPDWYYTGGQLGTTTLTTYNAFEQPSGAVEEGGFDDAFKRGEAFFEKPFMENNFGVRHGLGPVYIRRSCMHCHPGYGHGQRVEEGRYRTDEIGNGTLLVVYSKSDENYVKWLSGMPQFYAVAPFKAPLDNSKISVTWKNYTDEWGNKFPDGETYELQYPEVNLPKEAIYVCNNGYEVEDYGVKLESTIGIFGTGLLDAIPDDSIKAQYDKFNKDGYLKHGLNPFIYKDGKWNNLYKNTKQGDGTGYVRRLTYALSRGPIEDGAGANAIWNITNVTRSDRRYHYLDAAGSYAEISSKDPDVQAGFDEYIAKVDPKKEHPTWWEGKMEDRIKAYLLAEDLPVEMTDDEYTDLMVWHRGLAVPAVRGVNDPEVLKGKKLFEEMGCTYCHRPSWTTGPDEIRDPNNFFEKGTDKLPRYPYQKIWPYSDMVQHKLCMENDIRTGWCRTTPLWGRGMHQRCTGAVTSDRLHDCRARNVIEAIMWHGNKESDARRSTEKFRNLSKEERDAVVKFIDAI